MVRVGGMSYDISPNAKNGSRINNMMLKGKPIDANKKYKVAGWASVQEGVQGEPIDLDLGHWQRTSGRHHARGPTGVLERPSRRSGSGTARAGVF